MEGGRIFYLNLNHVRAACILVLFCCLHASYGSVFVDYLRGELLEGRDLVDVTLCARTMKHLLKLVDIMSRIFSPELSFEMLTAARAENLGVFYSLGHKGMKVAPKSQTNICLVLEILF